VRFVSECIVKKSCRCCSAEGNAGSGGEGGSGIVIEEGDWEWGTNG
jgi:hypothetical protein